MGIFSDLCLIFQWLFFTEEQPTHKHHEPLNLPMRKAVSLDDYEKMGVPPPRNLGSNPSCSSILEDDDGRS